MLVLAGVFDWYKQSLFFADDWKINIAGLFRLIETRGTVLDLTRNVFETLRRDEEFVLYRGRSMDDASKILILAPGDGESQPDNSEAA